MPGQYAVSTDVSSDRSRQEIEKTLSKYGARQFMYGWGEHEGAEVAVIAFQMRGRQVRFQLKMPDRNSREFTHTPTRMNRRSATAQAEAYEQAVKQRWRALLLVIKGLLEGVEVGIVSFEDAFLAHIMLPNGQSVSEAAMPAINEAYETGTVASLLPPMRPALEA